MGRHPGECILGLSNESTKCSVSGLSEAWICDRVNGSKRLLQYDAIISSVSTLLQALKRDTEGNGKASRKYTEADRRRTLK